MGDGHRSALLSLSSMAPLIHTEHCCVSLFTHGLPTWPQSQTLGLFCPFPRAQKCGLMRQEITPLRVTAWWWWWGHYRVRPGPATPLPASPALWGHRPQGPPGPQPSPCPVSSHIESQGTGVQRGTWQCPSSVTSDGLRWQLCPARLHLSPVTFMGINADWE